MPIQGFRHTGNFAADERPKSWREGILLRQPNGNTPLLALTNLMKSEKTSDPEYYWWEKPIQDRRLRVSEAIDAVETGFSIHAESNALLFKAGDVFVSPASGERFLMTANPTAANGADVVTLQRGFAGSTAAAWDPTIAGTHPYLIHIGSVYPEGSDRPKPTGNEPVKVRNYTQIFRDTFAATRTAMRTKLRTKDAVTEARRECLETHGLGIERAMIYGMPWEGTVPGSSEPARMTGGILHYIPAENKQVADAATSMDELESYMERMFRFGSSQKLGFAGSTALLIIQQIIRKNTNYQIFANETEYGMKVMRLVCPFGELVLKNHPMFNLDRQSTLAYGNSMAASLLVLDGANLRYRYVDDTAYQPKLQANGIDGMESGFLTECGLEIHHGVTHFFLQDLKAPALDA